MRTLLIVISFLCFSMNSFSLPIEWALEKNKSAYSVLIKKTQSEILINYCFIYNNGNVINCMELNDFIPMKKNGSKCFFSEQVENAWNGKKFPLSICFENKEMSWKSTGDEEYIPKSELLIEVKN